LLIVHDVLFDADWSQLKRLSLEGFFMTFIATFIGLIILEKIFTLEEDEEILALKKRVAKLEKEGR
jgi:hypothetical protein